MAKDCCELDDEGFEKSAQSFIEFEEEAKEVRRGDVYFVESNRPREPFILDCSKEHRPCVVLSNSNEKCFDKSEVVTIVFLSATAVTFPHTNVSGIAVRGRLSTAICAQVTTIAKSRLREYAGTVPEEKMEEIESAVCLALGIERGSNTYSDSQSLKLENKKLLSRLQSAEAQLEAIEKKKQSEIDYPEYVEELKLELSAAEAEARAYKEVNQQLMNLLV